MKANKINTFYERTLPHIQPIGATFFVTFRLHGTIPNSKLYKWRKEYEERIDKINKANLEEQEEEIYRVRKLFFAKYDEYLDKCATGNTYLKQPEIAELVAKEIHRFNGEMYDLIAYCIMSNHVHLLIDTSIQIPEFYTPKEWEMLELEPLQNIMKRIKGPTAVYANRILDRSGRFWQKESYDHYVRNQKELQNIIAYILNNPVKAGLVERWEDYPFTFLK